MSEEHASNDEKPAVEGSTPSAPGNPAKQSDPVKRWTYIVLAVCLVLLVWYLRSDRLTPTTSQARVHALVVPIAPEISGTVTGVKVGNSQVVSAGQELFQLDIERYEYDLQNAQAALDQAYQGQGAAQANVEAATASLRAAIANRDRAESDARRMKRIREQDPGAISVRRLDSAVASLAVAEGNVEKARAAVTAAREQLGKPGDANAQIQQARASVETARLNLDRATVRAPEDGVVTGVQLDKGNFAAAGAPQMTFISAHNIWIQADFKENNLGHLKPGNEVEVVFDVLPGKVFEGTVREIGFGVDVGSPPLGKIQTITNYNSWLRSAQLYQVVVHFELPLDDDGRTLSKVGSHAPVVVYTGRHPLMNFLARVMLRLRSVLTYAY
mgnify:FL=1